MHYLTTKKLENQKITIILAGEKQSFVEEFNVQLSQYPGIKINDWTGTIRRDHSPINASAIYYFLGYGASSYSQSLMSTTVLLDYLEISAAKNCPMFIILGPKSTHVIKTAITICQQFSLLKQTRVEVIQTFETDSYTQAVEDCIKRTIYNHKNIIQPRLNKNILQTPTLKTKNQQTKKLSIKTKILLTLTALLLGYIFFIQTASYYMGSTYIKEFSSRSFPQSMVIHESIESLNKINALRPLFRKYSYISSENEVTLKKILNNLSQISILDNNQNYKFQLLLDELRMELETKKNISELNRFESSLLQQMQKLSLDLEKLDKAFSSGGLAKAGKLLISLHDENSISPHGGKIEGFLLIGYGEGGVENISYYSESQMKNIFSGKIKSSLEFEKISGKSYLEIADLSFNPIRSEFSSEIISIMENSLSIKITTHIPLSSRIFDELFCPLFVSLDSVCGPPANTNLFEMFLPPEKIIENINNLGVFEINSLVLKFLAHLSGGESYIHNQSADVVALDLVGWGSGIFPSECTDWFDCQINQVQMAFYSSSSGKFISNLNTNVYITIQPDISKVGYLLSMEIPEFSTVGSHLIFWLVIDPEFQLETVKLNDQDINPSINNSLIEGKSKIGISLNKITTYPSTLNISFSKLLKSQDRFRYQLNLLSPQTDRSNTNVSLQYPPQWGALTHLVPSVATTGKLGYNTSLPLLNLIVDFIPK